jgi:hypothetical protein
MILSENKKKDSQPEQQISIKQLRSKMSSVTNNISNLLQKKIRIELEIKKQKKVLTRLKNQSSFQMKALLQLEEGEIFSGNLHQYLEEKELVTIYEDLFELDHLLDESVVILREIENLEKKLNFQDI